MVKKYWKCKVCKKKYREFGSYHENIGLSNCVTNEHTCIKCYNKGVSK